LDVSARILRAEFVFEKLLSEIGRPGWVLVAGFSLRVFGSSLKLRSVVVAQFRLAARPLSISDCFLDWFRL